MMIQKRIKESFNKIRLGLLKQYNSGPLLGALKDIFGRAIFYITMVNFALIAVTQWRRGKSIPLEYLMLSVVGLALIIIVIILPFASRGYGIERTYCQMATFLSIYFVAGTTAIAGRLKLKPYMLMLPILLLYLSQNFSTTLNVIV